MKPEYLPGTVEKVATGLLIVGLLAFIASWLFFLWSPLLGYSLTGSEVFLLVGLAGLITLLGLVAVQVAAKNRRAAIHRDNLERIQASAELPVISGLSTADAILVLRWRMDFDTHYKVHTSLLIGRARLIPFVIMVWIAASIMMFSSHVRVPFPQMLPIMGIIVGALVVEIVFILAMVRAVARRIMRKQYSTVPTQHFGLILDTDGLRVVTGNIVSSVPWKRVNYVQEFQDNVWLVSRVSRQVLPIIPSSAFHSVGDGKAFAATVRALRRGKQRSAHNWSGYGLDEPAADGVWPPAIR